ncbi:SRPBCC family protein [Streptomyces sp. Je 1-79]|uniref:SRPBCC family protein n=1 Tax=Streptomyces sp. Je 1-79 TaxID=2943847 RepID=UPI0021A6C367|nr:SRPBCC family protein [Streptomyces sp. Je 1-79]MCT4353920.1 SRPBCC family protein [Streptomyces sp. Je 1-79]
MADSTLGRIKSEVAANPATDRLKEELRLYLTARAEDAVTRLGQRLGDGVGRLAEPGRAKGGIAKSLAKGGQALGEGKSPARAALTAGTSAFKEALKGKAKGLFGSGRGSGGGGSKSVTIVEDIDVGVPVREAYDQWTQFQEFSTFAKGVVSVETADDTTTNWKVKVAKSTRSWQANVTEQIPDERITWTTEGAKGTVRGVVTFHRLTDDLTRVLLVLEYFPKGLFEKTGNIWRAQGRRARLDLKLYRKFLMMRGEATDGWRGEVRDGEVVVGHEEAVEREESRAEGETEDLAETDADEDAPEAEEEYVDEEYDAHVDEEEPEDEGPEDEGLRDEQADEEFDEEPQGGEGYDDEAYEDEGDEVEAPEEADPDDDVEERSPRPARRSRRRSATVGS